MYHATKKCIALDDAGLGFLIKREQISGCIRILNRGIMITPRLTFVFKVITLMAEDTVTSQHIGIAQSWWETPHAIIHDDSIFKLIA